MYYRTPPRSNTATLLVSMRSIDKGKIGEDCAIAHLQSQGYKLYARNVRIARDEIDAILFHTEEKTIVFLEVKSRTRNNPDFSPALGLTSAKRKKLFRSAHAWVDLHDYEGSFRIDVIYVTENRVTDHIQSITST